MSTTLSAQRNTIAALLFGAAAYAASGAADLTLRPPFTDNHLHVAADYMFTALGFPFVLALLLLLASLRKLHAGRDGRLGRIGYSFAIGGLAGLTVALIASLVTADERALSPLYPLASLATFIGVVLYATAAVRARVLPRWVGPAVAAAWIVGGPIAPGRGLFLIQTVVWLTVAATLARAPEPSLAR